MYCYCCNQNYAGVFTSLCPSCHRIRHLQSVYGVDRVLEVLENVLVRDKTKQKYKEDTEIKKEKEKIENTIKTRSQTKNV
jgi:precorrin-6B methylase 1